MQNYGEEYAIRISGGAIGIGITDEDPIWLMSLVSKPSLADRYLDIQAETVIRQIKYLAEARLRLLFGGGVDFATNNGICYPPRLFREIVLPRIRRVTEECHRHGIYFLISSDGNLWELADDLFSKSGIDGYYEVDRRADMNLGELRKRFPHLVLVGNISSHTMH